jgi:5-methylcytosine-specific restriction endonuclease McrA
MSDQADYYRYIRSDAWREKRALFFKSKLPKLCASCGAIWRPGFHLHHRTYKRLGNERLCDLILLCEPCHDALHVAHRKLRKPIHLWQFTRKFIRRRKKKALSREASNAG